MVPVRVCRETLNDPKTRSIHMEYTNLNAFSKPVLQALNFAVIAATLALLPANSVATPVAAQAKPTIVLVHGAFAGSSSWNKVISLLLRDGYPVVAVANPLRGLKSDSEYLTILLLNIKGPIVAVGHSYAGSVITNAANDVPNVKALVYVAGLAPDSGESAADISDRFPGSSLGPTLAPPVPLPGGGKDLYIRQDKFYSQFAADVPESEARIMAATQRPVTEAALHDPAGSPAWKTIPSWFIFGSRDKNITEAAHLFMAHRAKSRETVDVRGASHVVMISHPGAVVALIEKAAESVQTGSPEKGALSRSLSHSSQVN